MMDRGTVRNMSSFISKNKFEKLVHLVVFIIRIYRDARSPEHEINYFSKVCILLAFLTRVCHDVRFRERNDPFVFVVYSVLQISRLANDRII